MLPFFKGEQITIYTAHTAEQACHYGRGTRWCTAPRNIEHSAFDEYNKEGQLYIIIPKAKYRSHVGEKYQVHIESGSFMDEIDEPVSTVDLIQKYPELDIIDNISDIQYGAPVIIDGDFRLFWDRTINSGQPEVVHIFDGTDQYLANHQYFPEFIPDRKITKISPGRSTPGRIRTMLEKIASRMHLINNDIHLYMMERFLAVHRVKFYHGKPLIVNDNVSLFYLQSDQLQRRLLLLIYMDNWYILDNSSIAGDGYVDFFPLLFKHEHQALQYLAQDTELKNRNYIDLREWFKEYLKYDYELD